MVGNVYQWLQDKYHKSYAATPSNGDPLEDAAGSARVIRGGSFESTRPDDLGAESRSWSIEAMNTATIGFRLARSITE